MTASPVAASCSIESLSPRARRRGARSKGGAICQPPTRRRICAWSAKMKATCRGPCAPICASFVLSILRSGRYVVDQPRGAKKSSAHHAGRAPDRTEQRRERLRIADRDIVDAEAFPLELEAAGAVRRIAAFAVGEARGGLGQNLMEDGRRLALGGGEIAVAR